LGEDVILLEDPEVEYQAMENACLELTLLYLPELKVPISMPTPLYRDNQAVLRIATNLIFYECTKHIEREKLQAGMISPSHHMSLLIAS